MYKNIYLAKRNPSVAPEDWPRTWRSHPKLVSQYPAVGATIDRLNYCSRVREPTLEGKPFDPPGASTEYDGVAVVESADGRLHRLKMAPDDYARVMEDERRVFSTIVQDFMLQCQEVFAFGENTGPAAVIRFLARTPQTSRDDFLARWHERTAATAKEAVTRGRVIRYAQNAVIAEPPPGYEFDGISETWFLTVEDAVRSFSDRALSPLAAEQPGMCEAARSVTMLTEVIYTHPRARGPAAH